MAWTALVLSGTLALQQLPTYRQEQEVRAESPHTEAIRRAEAKFVQRKYDEAKRLVEEEIGNAGKSGNGHDLADSYDCLAWMMLKTPAYGRERNDALLRAEAYAAQAADTERGDDRWWRDYVAIRLRRAMDEGNVAKLTTINNTYRIIPGLASSLARPGDRKRLDREIAHALHLDRKSIKDPVILDTGAATRMEMTHAEMLDALLRERADGWSSWLALHETARGYEGGEALYAALTERTSGALSAIAAVALARLRDGRIDDARGRLREAHAASPAAVDVLLLMTLTDVAARDSTELMADYRELRRRDPALAMMLRGAGIDQFLQDEWQKSARAAAQLLFFARGLHLLGADEAWRGAQRSARGQGMTEDEMAALQDDISGIRAELQTLRQGVAERLDHLERDADKLEARVMRLSEQEQRDYANNQRLIIEAQREVGAVRSRLNLSERQIRGISAAMVLIRHQMQSDRTEFAQRLRNVEATAQFRGQLIEDMTALRNELQEIDRRDSRFHSYAARQIVALTADIGRLDQWQLTQDVQKATDALFEVPKDIISTFVPGGKARALLLNIALSLCRYWMERWEASAAF